MENVFIVLSTIIFTILSMIWTTSSVVNVLLKAFLLVMALTGGLLILINLGIVVNV